MKKNKLYYTTAALMLFCANTSAMEYSNENEPAKKITFLICSDGGKKSSHEYLFWPSNIRVVRDTVMIGDHACSVKIGTQKSDQIIPKKNFTKYGVNYNFLDNLNYNYPYAPDDYQVESVGNHQVESVGNHQVESITIFPMTLAEISSRKKNMKNYVNKSYIEMMEQANQVHKKAPKLSLFKRMTSSVSDFFYRLLGKEPPLPISVRCRFEEMLGKINKVLNIEYVYMSQHFTEKQVFEDLPELKKISEKFRYKFDFKGIKQWKTS